MLLWRVYPRLTYLTSTEEVVAEGNVRLSADWIWLTSLTAFLQGGVVWLQPSPWETACPNVKAV